MAITVVIVVNTQNRCFRTDPSLRPAFPSSSSPLVVDPINNAEMSSEFARSNCAWKGVNFPLKSRCVKTGQQLLSNNL